MWGGQRGGSGQSPRGQAPSPLVGLAAPGPGPSAEPPPQALGSDLWVREAGASARQFPPLPRHSAKGARGPFGRTPIPGGLHRAWNPGISFWTLSPAPLGWILAVAGSARTQSSCSPIRPQSFSFSAWSLGEASPLGQEVAVAQGDA